MERIASLAFVALAVTLGGCSSCHDKNVKPEPDAATSITMAPAPPPPASTPTPAAASAPAEEPAASASAKVAASAPSSGGPWSGTYHCFNSMRLTQSGSQVTGVLFPGSSMPSNVSCTVSGDKCTGTVTAVSMQKGKPPKVVESKGVTLRRDPNGDVHYLGAREVSPTYCKK